MMDAATEHVFDAAVFVARCTERRIRETYDVDILPGVLNVQTASVKTGLVMSWKVEVETIVLGQFRE